MNQERKLSFFLPPISPVKDANGKNVTPATLVPHKELTLEEVWNIVTGSPEHPAIRHPLRNFQLPPERPAAGSFGIEHTGSGSSGQPRGGRKDAPAVVRRPFPAARTGVRKPRRTRREGFRALRSRPDKRRETECGREHLLADGIRPPEVWRLLGQRQGQRSGLLGQRPGAGLLPVA